MVLASAANSVTVKKSYGLALIFLTALRLHITRGAVLRSRVAGVSICARSVSLQTESRSIPVVNVMYVEIIVARTSHILCVRARLQACRFLLCIICIISTHLSKRFGAGYGPEEYE